MGEILAIPTKRLFEFIPSFTGFWPCEIGIIRELEEKALWMERGQIEEDPNYKHPIGYCAVIGPNGKIFVYKRAEKDKDYGEKRLQGKLSIGIGGHIKLSDAQETKGPILTSVDRELSEEITIIDGVVKDKRFVGIINDSDLVGQVHLGLLMVATITSNIVLPKASEIAFGEMLGFDFLDFLICKLGDSVESWTSIGFPHVRSWTKI